MRIKFSTFNLVFSAIGCVLGGWIGFVMGGTPGAVIGGVAGAIAGYFIVDICFLALEGIVSLIR